MHRNALAAMILALCAASSASAAGFAGHVALGGGGGGPEGCNFTFELGVTTTEYQHNHLFAFGAGAIFGGNEVPDDAIDRRLPHADFTDLGWRQKDEQGFFFGRYGIETIPRTGLYATVHGGVSVIHRVRLHRSNVTGWYYERGSSYQGRALVGGGVAWFPPEQHFALAVDWDNRRGVTGTVGFRW